MTRPRIEIDVSGKEHQTSPIYMGYLFPNGSAYVPDSIIGFRGETENHGGYSQGITVEELASLLTMEDIEALRRQKLYSANGVGRESAEALK